MQRSSIAIAAVLGAVLLASCSTSLPVVGQMQRSEETFNGAVAVSGYRGGSGELTILSNHSVTCRGGFTYITHRRGEGVLNCDDGRTGPFHLSGVGASGSGYGDLDGQRFTFTFGTAT